MSPSALNDSQAYLPVKSESPPPLQSAPVSSTRHPHSQYPHTHSQIRFGTGGHDLPSFSFMSQPRSSSPPAWHPHTSTSSVNPYSSSGPSSQPHFALPPMDDPAVLTLTDDYDDGDELSDLPPASSTAVDIFHDFSGSSSRALDKTVRRRSSKGILISQDVLMDSSFCDSMRSVS